MVSQQTRRPTKLSRILASIAIPTVAAAPGVIYVSGADARHVVEGIRFENVTRYGRCIREHAPYVKIGKHATDIQFLCAEGDGNTTAKP